MPRGIEQRALTAYQRTMVEPSELLAIETALDELIAYLDVVGDEEDHADRMRWAIRRLEALLARASNDSSEGL